VQVFTGKFGYPQQTLTTIGVLELSCAVLYAIPQTAVLGAVLMTGYLGGAVATHVRISDPEWVGPAVLGVVAWVGLYLREARLRELLPLRRLPRQSGNP
jgi:DoxX-like protein